MQTRLQTLSTTLAHNPASCARSGRPAKLGRRTVHVLSVDVPYDSEASGARDGVRLLRAELVPQALAGVDGAHWAVGGDPAVVLDTDQHLGDRHAVGHRRSWSR